MERLIIVAAALLVLAGTSLSQEFKCVPGSTFKQDCNTCRCSDDGQNAGCTLKACLPSVLRRNRRETCTPGETFQRECNTCHCANDGKSAICTLKACPSQTGGPREKRAPRDGERCEPGIRYMDECNLCICSQDGIKAHASCTINICRSKRDTQEMICVPGTSYKKDCNTCRCSDDGLNELCTLKACLPRLSGTK